MFQRLIHRLLRSWPRQTGTRVSAFGPRAPSVRASVKGTRVSAFGPETSSVSASVKGHACFSVWSTDFFSPELGNGHACFSVWSADFLSLGLGQRVGCFSLWSAAFCSLGLVLICWPQPSKSVSCRPVRSLGKDNLEGVSQTQEATAMTSDKLQPPPWPNG